MFPQKAITFWFWKWSYLFFNFINWIILSSLINEFIFSFLLNLLEWHWLTKLYRFQVHHLQHVLCIVCSPPQIKSLSITIYSPIPFSEVNLKWLKFSMRKHKFHNKMKQTWKRKDSWLCGFYIQKIKTIHQNLMLYLPENLEKWNLILQENRKRGNCRRERMRWWNVWLIDRWLNPDIFRLKLESNQVQGSCCLSPLSQKAETGIGLKLYFY